MQPLLLQATPAQTALRQRASTILHLLCCLIGFQPAAMGQFLPATNYPTIGRTPLCIATGDLNGDGIPDLATANQGAGPNTGSVSILLGNGDGTFKPAVEYDSGSNVTTSVAVGDFNGDGILDLAIVNQTSRSDTSPFPAELDLLLGNGDGTFRAGMSYIFGFVGRSVTAGDFNADGRLDLVVVTASSTFILLGNGDGTFGTPTDIGGGRGLIGIVAADLNHDGKLDMAVTNYTGNTVDVFLGNGDGTFKPSGDYPTGYGPETVAIGDFDKDGNLDLVVANAGSAATATGGTTVSVLLGNGDGTFKTTVSYFAGSEPVSAAVGDMDGDGKLDLIVADFDVDAGNEISLLRGNGDGTFQAPVFYSADTGPEFVAVADLNHDGRLDVAVADFENSYVSVFLNSTGKITPILNWYIPDPIIAFGSALSSSQLDATADVPGTFVYNPPVGTVLPPGIDQLLTVTFTPTDTADYTTATSSNSITVNPAGSPSSPANLITTQLLMRSGDSLLIQLMIANTGGASASNVVLTDVKVGADLAMPLPLIIGTIAGGASTQVTLEVPGFVGVSGAASSVAVSGTYTGATFGASARVRLP